MPSRNLASLARADERMVCGTSVTAMVRPGTWRAGDRHRLARNALHKPGPCRRALSDANNGARGIGPERAAALSRCHPSRLGQRRPGPVRQHCSHTRQACRHGAGLGSRRRYVCDLFGRWEAGADGERCARSRRHGTSQTLRQATLSEKRAISRWQESPLSYQAAKSTEMDCKVPKPIAWAL